MFGWVDIRSRVKNRIERGYETLRNFRVRSQNVEGTLVRHLPALRNPYLSVTANPPWSLLPERAVLDDSSERFWSGHGSNLEARIRCTSVAHDISPLVLSAGGSAGQTARC